jgi:hypothetical protein
MKMRHLGKTFGIREIKTSRKAKFLWGKIFFSLKPSVQENNYSTQVLPREHFTDSQDTLLLSKI